MVRIAIKLSLVTATALALAGLSAGAAAATYSFTAPGAAAGTTTYLTGASATPHVIQVGAGEATCGEVSLSGSLVGPSVTSITLKPSYKECTAFGFQADLSANGCAFYFLTPGSKQIDGSWSGESLHVECPTGKYIEITPTFFGFSVCTAFLEAHTPATGQTTYTNGGGAGSSMDFTLNTNTGGVHYASTGEPCGTGVPYTNTNGSYTGSTTIRGFSNSAHTTQFGVTVE